MHLEHLCDLELNYRDLKLTGSPWTLVRPFGTEEGTGYCEGDGKASGPRLNGNVRWVNHPHRRSDGVMLPDANGIILADDGAILLFSLQGRTYFAGEQGRQMLLILFETEAEEYQWLNTALCVVEGVIEGGAMCAQVYECVGDWER